MENKSLIINICTINTNCLKRVVIRVIFMISGVFFTIFPHVSTAQQPGYHKVLDQDNRISGSFGEFRTNHFHSGIDYKTGEKEGLPVYAAADGYVSRVKVSTTGYGKVLYIDHPDGTTTVYAHLRSFISGIADTVAWLQREKKQFEQEFFPKSGEFPVKGGQIIGYSGNSGGSQGPHLHFEIRNTQTEKPFNPSRKGYLVNDSIPPLINSVVFYQPGTFKSLFRSQKTIVLLENPLNPILQDTISVSNEVFIGFEAHDLAGIENNRLGLKSYRLFRDGKVIFSFAIDEFSFDETRMVNACIDHPFKMEAKRTIMLCTRLPGNELTFFGTDSGLIKLQPNQTIRMRLETEDYSGNIQKLEFIMKNDTALKPAIPDTATINFSYGQPVTMEDHDFRMKIHEKSFYENVRISVEKFDSYSSSPAVSMEPRYLAVNKPIHFSLRPGDIPKEIQSKLLIARVDSGEVLIGWGGKFENGWVTATTRSLGTFRVAVDTLPPVASEPYWRIDDFTLENQLVILVNDDLAGLLKYDCYINEEWVCGEYNSFRSEIVLPPEILSNTNEFFLLSIKLSDTKSNSSEFSFKIEKTRPK